MTTQPEALRLADILEKMPLGQCDEQAAAELRDLDALNAELLEALKNLRYTTHQITCAGEFAMWLEQKQMPWAAAKELQELSDMSAVAARLIAKAEGRA